VGSHGRPVERANSEGLLGLGLSMVGSYLEEKQACGSPEQVPGIRHIFARDLKNLKVKVKV
jgi:hypothetical protein